MLARLGDGRLQPSRLGDGLAMKRHEDVPAALIEPKGPQIVVRRDQPHPPATGSTSRIGHRIEQGGADPLPLDQGVDGHDLALVAVDPVGGKADGLAVALGHEARQRLGTDAATFTPI